MRVFADVLKPTIFRSATLGVEVTLAVGLNEIEDEDLCNEMILRGVVKAVPEENPLVTAKDAEGKPKTSDDHESMYASAGQGMRLDIESARKTGVVDRASVLAHNRAAETEALQEELDLEKERREEEVAADLAAGNLDGEVHTPKVRKTNVVGTEAMHRQDLSDEEKRREVNHRTLGITPGTQKKMEARASGGSARAAAPKRKSTRGNQRK